MAWLNQSGVKCSNKLRPIELRSNPIRNVQLGVNLRQFLRYLILTGDGRHEDASTGKGLSTVPDNSVG